MPCAQKQASSLLCLSRMKEGDSVIQEEPAGEHELFAALLGVLSAHPVRLHLSGVMLAGRCVHFL